MTVQRIERGGSASPFEGFVARGVSRRKILLSTRRSIAATSVALSAGSAMSH